MANNLVIVESPAKVKTIKKFLGANYVVDASNGHVRDMPKSQLGFDVNNDYEPKYITIRGKGDILAKLRKEVKKADRIYLATDPDREGEAISWHLMKALKLDELKDKKVYRISFNEITKNAVKASLKSPRQIDMNLVDAQQARRVLDRMVGYSIRRDQRVYSRGILDAGRKVEVRGEEDASHCQILRNGNREGHDPQSGGVKRYFKEAGGRPVSGGRR